jgi:murein DD-endopeptidase MepM/ murein hydrolase activator NlpD
LLLAAGSLGLGVPSPAGADEAPVVPAPADAQIAIAGVTAADPNLHNAASFDLDAGDEDAPPRVSFGRALDLEGTPISLVTRVPRASGSRFTPGRNYGPAVMPSGSPLRFGSISSGYGSRWHPIYGVVRFHAGIDMAAPYGTPVYATSSGVIIVAGACGGYGQCVAIDHGGGVVSVYGHLSRIDVYPGRKIGSGQELGLVGSTGVSTGPHLHYEIRINGSPVNPRPYL